MKDKNDLRYLGTYGEFFASVVNVLKKEDLLPKVQCYSSTNKQVLMQSCNFEVSCDLQIVSGEGFIWILLFDIQKIRKFVH